VFPEPVFILEATAHSVFFAQYVRISTGRCKTDYEFVSPVYSGKNADGMLADIISALGMLFLERQTKDRSVKLAAAQYYSRALRKTQAALGSPERAKSDEMLTTVSLLALHDVGVAHAVPVRYAPADLLKGGYGR